MSKWGWIVWFGSTWRCLWWCIT